MLAVNELRQAPSTEEESERVWRAIFAGGNSKLKRLQWLHGRFPSPPRCPLCYAPFRGIGGVMMRILGKGRNSRNPRFCNACDKYLQRYPGGADVELSMMFVDIRGSVSSAEHMSPAEVSRHLSSFYTTVTEALVATEGFVVELRGDCVFGVYPPGFCGPEHARKAIEAARRLLTDTPPRTPDGALLPIGIGIHTGNVFACTVSGADGRMQEIGMHGDATNVAARLSQMAESGEALISDDAYKAGTPDLANAERRQLKLKGRSQPVDAWALRFAP